MNGEFLCSNNSLHLSFNEAHKLSTPPQFYCTRVFFDSQSTSLVLRQIYPRQYVPEALKQDD